MNNDKLILPCLQNTFGFREFKGDQKEIINNIINKKDTFVIMPTGGGKSLCYQLPRIGIFTPIFMRKIATYF